MESLKAVVAQKRKEKEEEFDGKKFVRRGEIVEKRLKRLRDAEEQDLLKRNRSGESDLQRVESTAESEDNQVPNLEKSEVMRRLRALGQPATLFGESEELRLFRLMKAEKEMHVEDDSIGGQQTNIFTEMRREEKAIQQQARKQQMMRTDSMPSVANQLALAKTTEEQTLKYFELAAEKLKALQTEKEQSTEEQILQQINIWCEEWKQDLESRSEEMKNTQSGNQMTLVYKQNMKWLAPLFAKLEDHSLEEEMVIGLWMIIKTMRERNYQQAYEVYLRLAIGNAPWPIGVTSVGIHERSAREKISHTKNIQGQAHIMNDEATRKYLQGIKRLMTFVQRAYPVDPSRSVDFSTTIDPGKGLAGYGSDRLALEQAEQTGVGPRALALSATPHHLERDGSVKVPATRVNFFKRGRELLKKDGP